jgi:hypothetical protein
VKHLIGVAGGLLTMRSQAAVKAEPHSQSFRGGDDVNIGLRQSCRAFADVEARPGSHDELQLLRCGQHMISVLDLHSR